MLLSLESTHIKTLLKLHKVNVCNERYTKKKGNVFKVASIKLVFMITAFEISQLQYILISIFSSL